jgi:hypothetical protein
MGARKAAVTHGRGNGESVVKHSLADVAGLDFAGKCRLGQIAPVEPLSGILALEATK